MKRFTSFALSAVIAASPLYAVSCSFGDDIKDKSKWHTVETSDFSITMPDCMTEDKSVQLPYEGQELLGMYNCTEAYLAVTRIPFSANEALRNIELKKYLQQYQVSGQRLDVKELSNGGYYYSYLNDISGVFDDADKLYDIEAMFKGSDGIYSVVTMCRDSQSNEYKDIMFEWLESFKIKN